MNVKVTKLAMDADNPAVYSWKRKVVVALLVVMAIPALLLVAGGSYQWIATLFDAQAFPMPGILVDAGDVELHVHCTGVSDTGPTVVLVPGMASVSSTFVNVQGPLSADWRVCSYDRDGLGWSGDSGEDRDAEIASRRLHNVLESMGLPKPYVLVGHSYGGLVARVFADDYRFEVSGLVLVDSAHEDMGERFPSEAREGFRDLLAGFGKLYLLIHTGVPRALNMMAPMIDGLNGEAKEATLSRLNRAAHFYASAKEAEGWDRSADRARRIDSFDDLPIVALVATGWPEFMLADWKAMQKDLAALSTQGSVEYVEGANHPQILMDERYSPRVVAAVRKVLDAYRSNQKQAGSRAEL